MKILVMSDTHGEINSVVQHIKNIEKFSMLLHLGDYIEDAEKIKQLLNIPAVIIRGNGDFQRADYNYDEILEINGKRIFLTHGHRYNVKYGITNLYYRALELSADVVLFGHTHIPIVERVADMLIMNPGSPTYPRGFNRKSTIGILDIGSDVEGKLIEVK